MPYKDVQVGREKAKERYRLNAEKKKLYNKQYRDKNRENLIAYSRKYFSQNREEMIGQMKNRYNKTKPKTIRQTVQRNLNNIKSKCKLTGIPFDISIDDINIPDLCPLLGIKLMSGLPRNSANSPSIDKIIPSLGYVKGNVWVVSQRANTIKMNATLSELKTLVQNLENKINEKC